METPEHDKLRAVKDRSQACGEFLDWLRDHGYVLCERAEEELVPAFKRTEQILAEFFEIDLDALEREKREMLAELRVGHAREGIRRELGLDP